MGTCAGSVPVPFCGQNNPCNGLITSGNGNMGHKQLPPVYAPLPNPNGGINNGWEHNPILSYVLCLILRIMSHSSYRGEHNLQKENITKFSLVEKT